MTMKVLTVSLALLLLPMAVGLAHADLCIAVNSGSILIADGLAVPARGTCRPLAGHFQNFPGFLASGVACTSSDGERLKLMWTDFDGGNYADFNRGTVPLPLSASTPGTVHILAKGTPGVATASGSLNAAVCNPKNQPVP